MITPDMINGAFELFGGLMNWLNVKQLAKDKEVKGVSLLPTFVFSAWGLWNLFYYPHLGQWWSFAGGCFIVSANVFWCMLALKYRKPARPILAKPSFTVDSKGRARVGFNCPETSFHHGMGCSCERCTMLDATEQRAR